MLDRVELFKDTIEFVWRYSRSGILDGQLHVAVIVREATADDNFSGESEFERVPDQIEHNFLRLAAWRRSEYLPHISIHPDRVFFATHIHDILDPSLFDSAAK